MTSIENPRGACDGRWQSMLTSGKLTQILTEVDAEFNSGRGGDSAFLLNWQATAQNQLGMHAEAFNSARRALEACTGVDDPKIEARIHVNVGMAKLGDGKIDDALSSIGVAERILRELGEEWTLGAALINHAVCEFSRGSDAGLALLNEASSCSPTSDTDQRQIQHRSLTIRINRAAGLSALGRTEDSIDELLIARTEALATENRLLLGHVDYNLAMTYDRLHLYGSMFEAAENSSRMYTDSGNERAARRSYALSAMALLQMGKHQEARDRMAEITKHESEIDSYLASRERPFWRQRKQFSDFLRSSQHKHALEVTPILQRFDELFDEDFTGSGYEESEELLSRLDAFNDTGIQLIAKFNRSTRDAYLNPQSAWQLSTEDLRQFNDVFGPRMRRLDAVAQGFAAVASGSLEDELNAWLAILWNWHDSWHDQHREAYRSDFFADRGRQRALRRVLELAVEIPNPGVIMETIETLRIDVSRHGSSPTALGLSDFSQVSQLERGIPNRDDTTFPPQYLAAPLPVTVRGRSAVIAAASLTLPTVELDQLRALQAGTEALWWSFTILDQTIYWSLLTPDSIHGGMRPAPPLFTAAFDSHLATLPIHLASDTVNLNGSCDPKLMSLVAVARCASTNLLGRPEITANALSLLPAHLRSTVAAYCESMAQIDLRQVYSQLSDVLLPEELKQALAARDRNARLIVTAPPELATLPIGLLPINDESVLLDHAYVQFAPPAGLAATLTGRPNGETPRSHLLSIINTAGDLASATRSHSSARHSVTGWGFANNLQEVATHAQIKRTLRSSIWGPGQSGLVSYLGHVVAGSHGRPGSAALVCAPEFEGQEPDRLSAREILSWGDCFPSHFYLGGCEGTGFGTGLEWASVAAATLGRGAVCVLAHAWPIIDCTDMTEVDNTCVELLMNAPDVGRALASAQRNWWDEWRVGLPNGIPPHFWAGLQLVGCTAPNP